MDIISQITYVIDGIRPGVIVIVTITIVQVSNRWNRTQCNSNRKQSNSN